MSEFRAWPKIPRLNRNCIATEKIDGTNAAVIVEVVPDGVDPKDDAIAVVLGAEQTFAVYAQSRKRLLQPNSPANKAADNFGFAAWVRDNAPALAGGLGEGYHYGEWWGSGIQRGYGQPAGVRHFSLFNSGRWHDAEANGVGPDACPECCRVVPVIAVGNNITAVAEAAMETLVDNGSFAAPFDNPEGIVVYHTAARQSFKVTVENDESPKGIFKGMHA